MVDTKPVNQTYVAIASCFIFLFTFVLYLAYVMFPTWQVQMNFEPSYKLTAAEQDIANSGVMQSLLHIPLWLGTIIITIIVLSMLSMLMVWIGPNELIGFIVSIIIVAVVLAACLILLGQLQNEQIVGTEVMNMTDGMIGTLGTIPNWIGIMISVALTFIILGYFSMGRAL